MGLTFLGRAGGWGEDLEFGSSVIQGLGNTVP